MKDFLNNNKLFIFNVVIVLLIIFSFYIKHLNYLKTFNYIQFVGYFALGYSLINFVFIKIILKKLSFLYSIDKIREFFSPVKAFLINDIFGKINFIDLKNKYKNIITQENKNKINDVINDLNIINIIKMFNFDKKINNIIRQKIIEVIYEIEKDIKLKFLNNLTDSENKKNNMQLFNDVILPIIESKIELSLLSNISSIIYKKIKNNLDLITILNICCILLLGSIYFILQPYVLL